MGVEYSSAVGFGFEISAEGLAYIDELDGEDGDGIEEYLYRDLPDTLTVVASGTYFDSTPMKYAISVREYTHAYGNHEGPSGIVPLDTPYLSRDQAHDLYSVALQRYLSEGQRVSYFYAGLWH